MPGIGQGSPYQQLTQGVSVHQSRLWQTYAGIIQGPEGVVLIDAGVFSSEYESIAQVTGPVAAGFCTHAHWDHVLWHSVLGRDTPRFATPETVALIEKDRNRILHNLNMAEEHLNESELWDRSLLFAEQPMPWGQGSIAGVEVELIPVPGHEDGQAALLVDEHGVIFVADTLSDIEVPSFSTGSQGIAEYLETLGRLEQLVQNVEWVVPGHGSPAKADEALRRLEADRRYLQALVPAVDSAEAGEGAEEIGRRILADLDEHRAESEIAAAMHLENITQLLAERERRESGLPVRRSSRLILLDDQYRVWMLRIEDPIRPRWILPGGGVEEGESWEDAARRELWEECAIDDAGPGPMVATRDRVSPLGDSWCRAQERYFLVRIDHQKPSGSNMTAHESGHYKGQRWFSVEDIRASYELVYPLGLADLIDEVRQGKIPTVPWQFQD